MKCSATTPRADVASFYDEKLWEGLEQEIEEIASKMNSKMEHLVECVMEPKMLLHTLQVCRQALRAPFGPCAGHYMSLAAGDYPIYHS